jgi:hypothetical protein
MVLLPVLTMLCYWGCIINVKYTERDREIKKERWSHSVACLRCRWGESIMMATVELFAHS